MSFFPKEEPEFSQFLVREYFRFGSVDQVLRHYRFSLPISQASYQRVLDKYGVVKAAGANSRISEVILFFEHLLKDAVNIETVYKKMPLSFQTSLKTIYRVYSYMKQGLTRRVGVALIISPFDNPNKVLLAKDITTPSLYLGKRYGFLSLPMGYARKRDSRRIGIMRVLQQEVFTDLVVKGGFPFSIVPFSIEPFMYLDIADVRVAVYTIGLPKELSCLSKFSSFKLKDYRFFDIKEILKGNLELRGGVKEAIFGYARYLSILRRKMIINPIQDSSILNKKLMSLSVDLEV